MRAGASFLLSQEEVCMSFFVQSDAKINISLRITGKRPDGYHELRSVFLRLSALESLTITPQYDHNVRNSLSVHGETVQGKNILDEVLARAGQTMDLPPLHISLVKNIPPGSGLGGGSGNAAALLSWLNRMGGRNSLLPEEFGSDVPFLFSDALWASVSGRGEIITPVASPPETPVVLVAVPSWKMSTQTAFSLIDEAWGGRFPLNGGEAERERDDLLDGLREQRHVGLLPNDFLPVLLNLYPRYSELFSAFSDYGAAGWGITGSGSACFGLFYKKNGLGSFLRDMTRYDWIRKIFCLE